MTEKKIIKQKIFPISTNASLLSLGLVNVLVKEIKIPFRLHETDQEIIDFFTRNGPNKARALVDGPKNTERGRRVASKFVNQEQEKLQHNYESLLKRTNKLTKMGILKKIRIKESSPFSLSLLGLYFGIRSPKLDSKKIEQIIKSNFRLILFHNFWSEIVEITGQKFAYDCLIQSFLQDILRIKFEAKNFPLSGNLHFLPPEENVNFRIRTDKKGKKLLKLISESVVLKNSYILTLLTQDLFSLFKKKRWPETVTDVTNLESEKALAFFENRSIEKKSFFITENLVLDFLRNNYKLDFLLTGIFLHKLLQ